MKLDVFQVDAFSDKIFGGNPACIVPLEKWLPDELLLNIAKENAVAETAYFIPKGKDFELRWFTPEIEMDLCGHATLATAHVLKQHLHYDKNEINFYSKSGLLKVNMHSDVYTLDFPSRKPVKTELPEKLASGFNIQPMEVFKARDYMLVYENEDQIRNIQANRNILDQLYFGPGGIIITAPGNEVDFVSRFFVPQGSVFEDPVTGSAHCTLITFWAERLHKQELRALQLSERKGKLFCVNQDSRVLISGHAKTYSIGTFWTE